MFIVSKLCHGIIEEFKTKREVISIIVSRLLRFRGNENYYTLLRLFSNYTKIPKISNLLTLISKNKKYILCAYYVTNKQKIFIQLSVYKIYIRS